MKHLIIGSGVIGKATGIWLLANNHEVYFNDKNEKVILSLKKEGYNCANKHMNVDVCWICTAEWNVEGAIKDYTEKGKIIVVRSTTEPGTMKSLQTKYNHLILAHNPEFLVEKTAIFDMFNPNRIIIGTESQKAREIMEQIYSSVLCPIIHADFTTSELIKHISNSWLAMQISFWNEMKQLCDSFNINPQAVANSCTLDKRISKYGTAMLGKKYSGFCFPKDTKTLSETFKKQKLKSNMIDATIKTNEELKK